MQNIDKDPILWNYKTFKSQFGVEPYLRLISDFRYRNALTKLRTSSHTLEIERGRYATHKTLACDRLCRTCNVTIMKSTDWLRLRDWDKFIQHNMTLYRCMISDIHDSSYILFNTNLISITNLHVGRPLRRPFLVAYAEATLARQQRQRNKRKVLTSFQDTYCGQMVSCLKWM